jgi:hypothetical protein
MSYETGFWGSLDLEPVPEDEFCLQAHLREFIDREDIIINADGGTVSVNGTVKYEENFVEFFHKVLRYLEDAAGLKATGTITGEGSEPGDFWRYVVKDNEYERQQGEVTYS